MVNGACARYPALVAAVVSVEAAALLAAHLPGILILRIELERPLEEGSAGLGIVGVRADALEALERELGRDLRVVGDQGLVRGL